MRAELSDAERAKSTARRKAIYEVLHPEFAHGGDQKSSRQVGDLNDQRFTASTAKATGRSERAVQRDAERARNVARRKEIYEALHPETKAESFHGNRHTGSRRQNGEGHNERFTSATAKATGRSERAVQRDAERGEKIAAPALALVVFSEGDGVYWLAEGFHRHGAAVQAGLETVACEVRSGGLREAILHSVGANATHGVRRSIADRRRAVAILLEDDLVAIDPETGNPWSDREIARRCAVDHKTVARVREDYLGKSPDEPRAVFRGGTVYEMKPRQRPADSAPEQNEPDPPQAAPEAPAASNVHSLESRLTPLPSPVAIETRPAAGRARSVGREQDAWQCHA